MKLKKAFNTSAVALFALSAPSAFAAIYTTSVPSLSGYVSVGGFADDPSTFTVTLRDLSGGISLEAGPSGVYNFGASLGMLALDFNLDGTPDFGLPNPALPLPAGPVELGTASVVSSGLTPGLYAFGFTPGVINQNDGPGMPLGFSFEYDGVLSVPFLNLINLLLGSTFVDPAGKGKLDVSGSIYSDGAVLNFTETDTNWVGFGALFAAADLVFDPRQASPGFADANFTIRGLEITATEVPEPASLALLGIGAMGLFAARRRKQA